MAVSLPAGAGAAAIAAGYGHSCALLANGTVQCWGSNLFGELGNGSNTDSNTPVAVIGSALPGAGAAEIVFGGYHSCALLSNGTERCWGRNANGELGNGSNTNTNTPVAVSLPTGATATAIAAGNFHSCALLSDGTVQCWGSNSNGQLGDGSNTDSNVPVPVRLPAGATATAIFGGAYHSCALLSNGTVQCWGYNGYGELGNGTNTDSDTPVAVSLPAGATATAISGLGYHSCALLSNGTVQCWGYNVYGELGNGTNTDSNVPVPVRLPAGATTTAISGGAYHSCAVLADGTMKCWGSNNFGELGNGSNTNSNTPVAVSLPDWVTATAIASGGENSCALLADGTVRCWGANPYGQLGNGTNTDSNIPVAVSLPAGAGATAIASMGASSCALLSNGTVQCWGYNVYGELGNGTNTNSNVPLAVRPLVLSVAWMSSNTGVATIDPSSGLATAVGVGTTTITATYGTLTANTILTVARGAIGKVTPTSVAFPGQLVGTSSSPKKVSLFNIGDYQMTVASATTSGDFAVQTNKCMNGVKPATHCDVYVVFSPAHLGALSGALTFVDSATNNPQTAGLTGIGQSKTSTTLTASPNPSALGQVVKLTALVFPSSGGTPTGTVTFYDGTTTLGTVPLNLGAAQLINSTLPGGSHSLTASYSGDAVFLASLSPVVSQIVKQGLPLITLGSGPNPSSVNQTVTFTATVTGKKGIAPSGTVAFKKGTIVLGTVALVNGKAKFATAFTKAGTFLIAASYSGDQSYRAQISKALKQVVK